MAVVGGGTKTVMGRMAEVTGWWPLMLALFGGGVASAFIQLTGIQIPGSVQAVLDLYHEARDWAMTTATGGLVNPKMADIAIAGIPLITMVSRRVLGFALSVGVFILLAAITWFVLKQFGHASV